MAFLMLFVLFLNTQSPKYDGPPMYSAVVAKHVSQQALQAAENLGTALAKHVIAEGAGKILAEAKQQLATEIIKDNEKRMKDAAEKNGVKSVSEETRNSVAVW